MEIIIRPTSKIVELEAGGGKVPARIWEGKTSTGIPVHCFVTRVAVPTGRPEHEYAEFEQALEETQAPSEAAEAIPLRLIL